MHQRMQQPLEAGNGKETDCLLEPALRNSPTDTLILAW